MGGWRWQKALVPSLLPPPWARPTPRERCNVQHLLALLPSKNMVASFKNTPHRWALFPALFGNQVWVMVGAAAKASRFLGHLFDDPLCSLSLPVPFPFPCAPALYSSCRQSLTWQAGSRAAAGKLLRHHTLDLGTAAATEIPLTSRVLRR